MRNSPVATRYLLRIDDLCPTVNGRNWEAMRNAIREFRIHPILAIVPENKDPALSASPVDPEFWTVIKRMQGDGATIALHGYQHLCTVEGRSLIPLHRWSEFAGAPYEVQSRRIAAGMGLLRDRGLDAKLFVAPRHGFDFNTLRALHAEGLRYLSDGFARVPFERGGVTWIPQQLWGPVPCAGGLWTICMHPNSTGLDQVRALRAFLEKHRSEFTTFEEVISEYVPANLEFGEWIYERFSLCRAVARAKANRYGTEP